MRLKQSMRRAFERLARRDPQGRLVITGSKIASLKEVLRRDFERWAETPEEGRMHETRSRTRSVTADAVIQRAQKEASQNTPLAYNWLPLFEQISQDGVIELYSFLETMDKVAGSYFLTIRHAKRLNIELKEQKEELLCSWK